MAVHCNLVALGVQFPGCRLLSVTVRLHGRHRSGSIFYLFSPSQNCLARHGCAKLLLHGESLSWCIDETGSCIRDMTSICARLDAFLRAQ